MGTWGEGAFENDAAADFLRDLRESAAPADDVRLLLERVAAAPKSEYLDVDDGQMCVAACELVAAAFGAGKGKREASIVEALRHDRALIGLSLRALPRVLAPGRSELAGLWPETEHFDDLYDRLSDALADALRLAEPDAAVLEAPPAVESKPKRSAPRPKPKARPSAPQPRAKPKASTPSPPDVRAMIERSPALQALTAAFGETWALTLNGVLNVYGPLSERDQKEIVGHAVTQVQMARRFALTPELMERLDGLFARFPDAVLRVTFNGFGAFEDISDLGTLPHLRHVVVDGMPPFLLDDATSVLEHFPNLATVTVNGVVARR
jgi:hypothetical protein